MPSNFVLTAVKRCFTSNQSLPHESRRAATCTSELAAVNKWLGDCGSGYGLGVFVYMFMCYMPMWVSMHRRTQCVGAPADWGNELGPPEVIVHVQAETRIGLFQSPTDEACSVTHQASYPQPLFNKPGEW